MTPHHPLLFLAAALAAGGCVHGQPVTKGRARGAESWTWRMSATQGKWNSDLAAKGSSRTARRAAQAAPAAEAAVEPEADMTLEPDPVAPVATPKAVARGQRRSVSEPRPSDSDEEFVDKILDGNADAEDGEITMAAMEMPKSAARAPAKKKRMTRAEKRRAKLLAKAEKKKAKQLAAREARLRGQRARVDEEEKERVAGARKARRNKKKGKFFKNGEGFIDDDDAAAEDDSEDEDEVASSDRDEDEDEADDDDEDEADDEDVDDRPRPAKKKIKATASKTGSGKAPVKMAAKGTLKKAKTDWSGQAVDDEDPLKGKKK